MSNRKIEAKIKDFLPFIVCPSPNHLPSKVCMQNGKINVKVIKASTRKCADCVHIIAGLHLMNSNMKLDY